MAIVDYSVDMYGNYMWPQVRFMHHIDEEQFQVILNKKWPNREFDTNGADFIYETEMSKSAFFTFEDGASYLSTSYGEMGATIAANSMEAAQRILKIAEGVAPKFEETDENKVSVTFWSLAHNGPQSVTRSLDVPAWENILYNYNESVGDQLAEFMNPNWRPTRGGQLMLWYGMPGTGKTTALRAMAKEWRDWCEIHYIADPEKFFGQHADYMMQVLISNEPTDDKWRLLVLEDCGELIASDAKQTSGQGLSRLLNAVDGLIGQGLRFMVLITTNEDLKKLNEAVTRPGRCLSQIEFGKLSQNEVIDWLAAHKAEELANGKAMTIAELYAHAENFGNKKMSKAFGFTS